MGSNCGLGCSWHGELEQDELLEKGLWELHASRSENRAIAEARDGREA